jgi:hypothetical protein
MFLVLLDPDPIVGGTDPDQDPSIIKEMARKTLNPTILFCDFFMTFYL